ncbi:hypothetical protein D3C80_1724400 [compost metagenome]
MRGEVSPYELPGLTGCSSVFMWRSRLQQRDIACIAAQHILSRNLEVPFPAQRVCDEPIIHSVRSLRTVAVRFMKVSCEYNSFPYTAIEGRAVKLLQNKFPLLCFFSPEYSIPDL